jgi:preprotein translocase subunit SecE
VSDYLTLFIWVAVIGVIFTWLWRRGDLLRLSRFVQETREELKKCSWPTWQELKGSTVVVTISIALLGAFTVLVDYLLHLAVRVIMM